MLKNWTTLLFINMMLVTAITGQGLTIQENEAGFCSVDGIIDTDVEGYTGDGFANADIAAGTSALWNISVPAAGTYHIYWRYANGGGSGDLFANVWVNEMPEVMDFPFRHTGSWRTWTETDTVALQLEAGENKIRLVSISASGLTNIDYLHVIEDGVTGATCLPSYALKLTQNDLTGGTISFEPEQTFYDAGAEITLRATANNGYFFQSWSGDATSVDTVFTFAIDRNTDVEALFFPEGTTAPNGIYGYATVQDDAGTPYLMTGGSLGDTVHATSYTTLRRYLEDEQSLVVTVADHIVSTGTINIKSNKTLLGITDSAHLEGIRIKINQAKNVILQNMTFSKVIRYDAIEINNSQHVWIDHCEFFSDLNKDKDYYDGLLDIKNAAAWITVSNTEFHDHHKAVLISSGDDSFQDTTIRITFHHNYFHNLGSRTPLMRFGKAHIFNNYFWKCSSGVNSRMEACLRVEKNYFFQVSHATRTDMSQVRGYFDLVDNVFEQSTYVSEPNCVLEVPYAYQEILDEPADLPDLLSGELSVNTFEIAALQPKMALMPNPVSRRNTVDININLPAATTGTLVLLDLSGRVCEVIRQGSFTKGAYTVSHTLANLQPGMYIVQLKTAAGMANQKLIVR